MFVDKCTCMYAFLECRDGSVLTWAFRVVAGVPDPFLGPKGLRGMLVFRGVAGYVFTCN